MTGANTLNLAYGLAPAGAGEIVNQAGLPHPRWANPIRPFASWKRPSLAKRLAARKCLPGAARDGGSIQGSRAGG